MKFCLLFGLLGLAGVSGQDPRRLQELQRRVEMARASPKSTEQIRNALKNLHRYDRWEKLDDPVGALGNLTLECIEDVGLMYLVEKNASAAPPELQLAVSQMHDASASITALPPGTLRGTRFFYGFKQECDVVRYDIPHSQRTMRGAYSRAYLDVALLEGASTENVCRPSIGMDVCLPASCNANDLLIVTSQLIGTGSVSPVCVVETMDEAKTVFNYKSWIVASIVIIFTVTAIMAGIVDYCILPEDSFARKLTGVKLFLAFSFYTNVKEILTPGKSSAKGQIGPIHFIRVISMGWVIISHTFDSHFSSVGNFYDALSMQSYPLLQIIMNGFFSVDNFFFIGGVLLSFLWFKEFERNRQAVMSIKGWVLFYVHRFIRLSPAYYMAVVIYTWVYLPVNNDKPVILTGADTVCNKYFWRNFLYINNLGKIEHMCLGHTWYLATDMQMYALTPALLITLSINPMMGFALAGLLFAGSTAGNIVEVYANHWPPTVNVLGTLDGGAVDYMELYFPNMYYAMWIRCQIYIMGLLVGWFLQRVKSLRIPQILNLGLWGLAIAFLAAPLFGLYNYNQGDDMPLFWRAMYSAFSKVSWGLGLSWVLISCYYGYGGPVNRFMSWNIWVPFGRLSYSAYLIHIPIITYLFGLRYNPIYYTCTGEIIWFFFVPALILTFAFALYFSCLFELPIVKLEKLLLNPPRRAKAIPEVTKTNLENGKVQDEWM